MSSPFSIFRKHQRILLVVLVGLSMLSFVIFDAIQNVSNMRELPPQLVVLTLAALIGAVAWVFGISNHKSGEYGMMGLLAGAAIGLVVVMQTRKTDIAVRTSEFNLTHSQLMQLINNRRIANAFTSYAIEETGSQLSPQVRNMLERQYRFGFGLSDPGRSGSESKRDVVLGELLRREIAKLGVVLPDSVVDEHINAITNGNMTREAFRRIRQKLDVSERQLIEALREELLARDAQRTLYPPTSLPPAVDWEFSQRLQVRQNATVAAVPVADFVDNTVQPTESELEELLAKYRENFPGFGPNGRPVEGLPGFRQPARIRMAYLQPNVLAYEREVEPLITDAMVAERYERDYVNAAKMRDGAFIPEGPSLVPPGGQRLPGLDLPALPAPSVPPAQEAPATPRSEGTPATPATSPPTPETPAPQGTPESTPPANRPTEPGSTPPTPAQDRNDSGCDDPVAADPEAAPKPNPPAPEAATAETAPAEKTPAEATPAGSTPATSTPANAPANPPAAGTEATPPALPLGAPETPPPVPASSVPPLDDALKAEIREQLVREETDKALDVAMEAAYARIYGEIARNYHAPAGSPDKLSLDAALKQIREYAELHHFVYSETGEVSYEEFTTGDDYRHIANLRQPSADRFSPAVTVAQDLFTSPMEQVLRPRLIEDRDAAGRVRERAIYWKLEHKPDYVPNGLSEERVREQVTRTWRELKAREIAEQRAQALAALARQSGQPLVEALGMETVTGQPQGTRLTILQTGQFSWMRMQLVPAMNVHGFDMAATPASIPGLADIGDDFRRIVFDELQPGDVGVAPSLDRSIYYVVRIDSRIPATPEQWDIVRNNFLSGQNDYLQQQMTSQLVAAEIPDWRIALMQKYEVGFPDEASDDRP